MKKIIIFISLFFAFSLSSFANNDDFDNLVCTMEYAPVCAEVQVQCIKAPCPPIYQTFGNSCTAGKNKIIYTGECDDYVKIPLYNIYMGHQDEIQQKLVNIPTKTLEKALELIAQFIPKTKELNVPEFVKKVRVTKYMFLKYVIEKELSER